MGSTSQQKTALCISVKRFELRVSIEGCLPQAFLCFWKLSAVIVLFSVAKIWETCIVLSILVFGLLRKQSAAQAQSFGRTCPP